MFGFFLDVGFGAHGDCFDTFLEYFAGLELSKVKLWLGGQRFSIEFELFDWIDPWFVEELFNVLETNYWFFDALTQGRRKRPHLSKERDCEHP